MGELKEKFKAYREYIREKREQNREYSTALLEKEGIKFESRNDGLHLIIETPTGRVNFYPSTGLYNGAIEGRGVKNLINYIIGADMLKCKNCQSTVVEYEDYIGGSSVYRCKACGFCGFKEIFMQQTVFDKITASPETLAEKFVFAITYGCSVGAVKYWYSTLEVGTYFSKKEEAIAATLERLNEVAE